MICRNCGYHNAPGDAFCGSCGQFLEWTGDQAGAQGSGTPPAGSAPSGSAPSGSAASGSGPSDETVVQPAPPAGAGAIPPVAAEPGPASAFDQPAAASTSGNRAARHSARPQRVEGPPRMARPAPSGVAYGAITCWNCGRRNPTSRAFCQQCGERLSVASLGGAAEDGGPASGRGRMLAVGLAVLALLLLAGGAAALLLGNSTPSESPAPTDAAVVTDSPAPPTQGASLPPTLPPTVPPTDNPTDAPTEPPTAPPVTAPPATPVNCGASSVPTRWVNLSGANTSERVRRNEVWCIHQVIIVPDPNFGLGTIRLRANDGVLAQVTHNASSSQTEYPFNFSPAQLVAGRQDLLYRMNCAEDLCNAVIQVGYEVFATP